MALETNNNNEAFLSGGGGEDDFAALDSMGLTGQSQYGMNTVNMSSSIDNVGSNNVSSTPTTAQTAGASGGVSDGTSGFSGVSGSLFDRIKARTAEQQKATQQPPALQQQEAAQSSSQQSVFMSQQQSQQPPSGEVTMELERHRSDEFNSSAPNNLASGMPSQNQNTAIPNTNDETTYSFSASGGGEDFSQQAQQQMHVPDYGVNRYAGAAGNNQNQYDPNSIQDQALSTMKSLWSTGVNSAQNTIAIAQQKMGIETNGADATPRSYNNNFLLREDSMEQGGIGATMQQPPPQPISAAQFDPEHVQSGSNANSSGMSGIMGEQGYSMLHYGKTFCEDVYAFVMQLPPVGKAGVGIILLFILYVLFG